MQDSAMRLQALRNKGASRTPEENAEYDQLVEQTNAANNSQTGGDANVSTQGQAIQPGQQAPQAPVQPGQTNPPQSPVNENANVVDQNANIADHGTPDNTQPGSQPGNDTTGDNSQNQG